MIEQAGSNDIRDLAVGDLDWLLPLNNASVPHVNHLERENLADIVTMAGYARCILQDGHPVGALIALWPGKAYASAHYRWFERHQSGFLYVDRVIIDGTARKGGYGRRLYADIERFAKASGAEKIALEVNSEPPNPISMSFHEALGFVPVGEIASEDRSKVVVLMTKALAPGPAGAS